MLRSLPYTLRIGTLMNAENADFFFLSAEISVFQRPKKVWYGREMLRGYFYTYGVPCSKR